jgi:aminoglycoside phosphotransferase (APT) family kinase protein
MVDFAALGAWMDREGLPGGPLENAEVLAGGTQNILVRFSRGGQTYVLRRPPPHPRPRSNDVLRREIRVLAALSATNLPHPRLIAACSSESVMGVVFYLTLAARTGVVRRTGRLSRPRPARSARDSRLAGQP